MNADYPAHKDTYTISVFFDSEQAVKQAVTEVVNQGVPRDLIDVAMSEKLKDRFFRGFGQPFRDSVFSFAGRGALFGLVTTAAFSVGLSLLPGFQPPGLMSMVQLLGPDVGIVLGGALGAVYGFMRRSHPKPQHLRALNRDALLLLVHLRPRADAERLQELLVRLGGHEPLLEPDRAEAVGAE